MIYKRVVIDNNIKKWFNLTWERLLETINRFRRSSEYRWWLQGSPEVLKCLEGSAIGPSIHPSVKKTSFIIELITYNNKLYTINTAFLIHPAVIGPDVVIIVSWTYNTVKLFSCPNIYQWLAINVSPSRMHAECENIHVTLLLTDSPPNLNYNN